MKTFLRISLLLPISFALLGCEKTDYNAFFESNWVRDVKYGSYTFSYYENGGGKLFKDNDKSNPLISILDCSFKQKRITSLKEGTSFIDVIKKVGFPRFCGITGENNLDFGIKEENIFRITFSNENTYVSYIEKDYADFEMWIDTRKSELPSREETESLELGMSLEEVVYLIGKPQDLSGSGAIIFDFNLNDGSKLLTWWESRPTVNPTRNGPYYLGRMEIQ